MKKQIAVVAALLTAFTFTAFAQRHRIPTRAESSFYRLFPNATDASFKIVEEETVVAFVYNGKHSLIVYQNDGSVVGQGSYLDVNAIPTRLNGNLQRRFRKFDVLLLLQFSPANEETYYYVSLLTDKSQVIAKVYNNGYVEVCKREDRF